MVNTRNIEPRVLDETLRTTVLEVIQEANAPVNAALTTIQTNMNTLTDRIQALMMFQTFATEELRRIGNGKGTSNRLIEEVRSDSGTYANGYTSHIAPVNMTKPLLPLPSPSTENASKVVKSGFRKQLTQNELEEKRAKGLCFYYDQRYAPGHKCPGQLYYLKVSVDENEQVEEVSDNEEIREENQAPMYTESFPHISLHALSRVNAFQTMRVRGYIGKQPLHILIDCGSTHNFLDTTAAKKLPCQLNATTPLRVDVANGSKMDFSVVLTLRDINCNFRDLTIKFNYKGKRIMLGGLRMEVCSGFREGTTDNSTDNLPLRHLLSTYADVFDMPTELPPQRIHDHAINLLLNTPPITVEYLGHVFSAQGVATDPLKIQAMAFLAYSYNSYQPLNKLLKKNGFHWSTEAEVAFNQLKQAMMTTPALTNLRRISLSPRHQALSTYENEFMAVVMALDSGAPKALSDVLSCMQSQPLLSLLIIEKRIEDRLVGKRRVLYKDCPFQIIKKIGQVAYQLALPASSQIYNVFHVSQLKKCTHPVEASGALPAFNMDGLMIKTPATILDRRLGKLRNSPVMYVLVQWYDESVEDATWEIYGDLITRFPTFDQAFCGQKS
ncbi:reverse transcriptase [Tanacetum coccineum]